MVRYTDDDDGDHDGDHDGEGGDDEAGGRGGRRAAGDGTNHHQLPHLQVPVGNGGVGPRNSYWWTQTLDDATLFLPLPADAPSGDIVVDIKPTRMAVALRGHAAGSAAAAGLAAADGAAAASGGAAPDGSGAVPAASSAASSAPVTITILSGSLHAPVRAGRDDDAALWTIETLAEGCPSLLVRTVDTTLPPFAPSAADASSSGGGSASAPAPAAPAAVAGTASRERIAAALAAMPPSQRALFTGPCKLLVVTLGKVTPTWWRWVLDGHPAIDATRVDSTLPVTAYDQETQAVIRKIVYDQGRKAAGLPTSDEEKAAAVLKEALAKPGSPFGTPGAPA